MRLDAPEDEQEEVQEKEVQEEERQEEERLEQVGGEVDEGVAGWELEWRVEVRRGLTTSGRF